MDLISERAYPTPFSNSPLLPLLLLSLARQRHTPDGSSKIMEEYDFVIVGSGSAGAVVANRLSEKPCVSVLLLEAGNKPPLLTEVPPINKYFWFTDVDWQYKTAPQKYTGRGLNNRQIMIPRGKMLGGCSSHNDMLYVRGNMKNYDDWEAQGAKGWSYKDVFPYFLKLENNKNYKFLKNGYHASGGPVTVHQPRYDSELKQVVYEAAVDMGYKIGDSNGAWQTGFYEHQATLRDNQRCGTAKAYLVPAESRTNLDILPNAMATKVIIRNHRTRGVRFDFKGRTYEVKARREVILSAGTINTAQLLMLSGVGPKRELQKFNIPVAADLPVGQNLQDHTMIFLPFVMSPRIPNVIEKLTDPGNIQQYINNRTGPLATAFNYHFLAFLKDDLIQPHVDFPSYEMFFAETTTDGLERSLNLKPEVYRRFYGPYENEPLFMCGVSQMQPKSRGSVTLQSKNPYEHPIIDPNFFADPIDVEETVQGMKTCRRIAANKSFRKLGVKPFETVVPGCENFVHDEDDYFRCFIKTISSTNHHQVGTAKMGDPRDPSTVVDPKLRVKNIKGLRVVDASVMPLIPSANTNTPTIMLAEKASDIIKESISCYKNWDDSDKEPSKWSGGEAWKDGEGAWMEDGKSWTKPKDHILIWTDHKGEWVKPKDTAFEDEERWEKPREKDVLWEDEEEWGKSKDEKSIWAEHEYRWGKSKDEENEYEEQWKKPKGTKWLEHEDQWKTVRGIY